MINEEHAFRITCDDPACASRNGTTTSQRVWAMTPLLARMELTGWEHYGTEMQCPACVFRDKLEAAVR